MIERLILILKKAVHAASSHRFSYLGLALTYGCSCFGWLDKDTVAQIATVFYVLMAAQRC